jgi:glycosyltransferase 2 family protein
VKWIDQRRNPDVHRIKVLTSQFRLHWVWIKWLAAIGILYWLFRRNRDAFVAIDWSGLDRGLILLAALLCLTGFLITFTRWYFLLRAQDLPVRYRDAVRLGFLGLLFNYVAPGSAGGDLVKALLIAREHPERKTVAAATVLLDRLLGLIALFCVGALASIPFLPLPPLRQLQLIASVLWVGAVAGLSGLFLMIHTALASSRLVEWMCGWRGIGGILRELQQGILLYRQRKSVLWLSVGLSLLGHFCILSVFYCASLALNAPAAVPSYLGHLFLVPAAELVGVLIPTPAGIGALEGAVQGVFAINHQMLQLPVTRQAAQAAGFSTALIFRAINMAISLLGAGYYLTARREIEEVLEDEDLEPHRPPA